MASEIKNKSHIQEAGQKCLDCNVELYHTTIIHYRWSLILCFLYFVYVLTLKKILCFFILFYTFIMLKTFLPTFYIWQDHLNLIWISLFNHFLYFFILFLYFLYFLYFYTFILFILFLYFLYFLYSEQSSEDRQPYHLKYRSDSPHIIEFEKKYKRRFSLIG